MLVIGLTGGIGTGKTAVASILRDLGAEIIGADEIAHEAYEPGTSGWQAVVDEFGEAVLTPGGEVDRHRLGAIVFQDKEKLERLNAIVHPRTRELIEQRIRQLKTGGTAVVVVEVPLLVEAIKRDSKWASIADEVWVTDADEDRVIERTRGRSQLDDRAIKARIRSQTSQKERLALADAVIDNNGSLEELRGRVHDLWRQRISQNRKHQSQT
jgi:dephospho-CoA kinase